MRSLLIIAAGCVFAVNGIVFSSPARAAGGTAASPAAATTEAPAYSNNGADTCLLCHQSSSKVMAIFDTRHAVIGDPHTPFAGRQCEACHGPGARHVAPPSSGQPRTPVPFFGAHSKASVKQENAVCLSCHTGTPHLMAWQGSVHQRQGLACVSCHTIHAKHDPVLSPATQPQVCYKCHMGVRADFRKFSAHPLISGQMSCSSCHNPMGSFGPSLLTGNTINQTCYQCHAAKRGPFLWEHPPVQENCANCHVPHGSVNPSLLVSRPPLLCQQCHEPSGHPSIAFGPNGLPSRNPNGFLLSGSCMNCHSKIHGSNDPSSAPLNH